MITVLNYCGKNNKPINVAHELISNLMDNGAYHIGIFVNTDLVFFDVIF